MKSPSLLFTTQSLEGKVEHTVEENDNENEYVSVKLGLVNCDNEAHAFEQQRKDKQTCHQNGHHTFAQA